MRYRDCVAVGFRNRLQRFRESLPPEAIVFAFSGSVIALYDKRRRALDNKALDAARDPLQRILCQRLFAVENAWRWN